MVSDTKPIFVPFVRKRVALLQGIEESSLCNGHSLGTFYFLLSPAQRAWPHTNPPMCDIEQGMLARVAWVLNWDCTVKQALSWIRTTAEYESGLYTKSHERLVLKHYIASYLFGHSFEEVSKVCTVITCIKQLESRTQKSAINEAPAGCFTPSKNI